MSKKNTPRRKIKKIKNVGTIKEQILALLNANPRKEYSPKKLFKSLQLNTKTDKMKAVEALEALLENSEIKQSTEGKFKAKIELQYITGKVDFVNAKFAYIVSEETEEDVWVDANKLHFALDSDIVKVATFPAKKNKRPEGEVVEIIERGRNEFVGRIEVSQKYSFVVADNRRMHEDIFIPKEHTNGAKDGYKVIVKIVEWHTETSSPVGVVTQVLGKAGENDTEMHAILAEYDLPHYFPPEIQDMAAKIKATIPEKEIAKRMDLRNTPTFTIDPTDAKDFDDALSIRKTEEGLWEVGIHIADVSHYVKPNTKLDKEAYQRGTSVYLVDRVVPMLPERISNEICSLRPNEDKLTFSAIFLLDDEAKVHKQWFGRTVIHSDRRFAYEEAQEVLDSGKGDYAQELIKLNELAKKLEVTRYKQGAINFETTEVKFNLDENGKPIGVQIKERKEAHKLIEEFMLLANLYVATFVYNLPTKFNQKAGEYTMVYRTHDEPDTEKLENFSTFARKLGHQIATQGKALSSSLNQLSENVASTAQQNILQSLAIRTMAKAKYTTEATQHFGLAFEHYTHFTSPIRRYPDLMVHRLLAHYLSGGKSKNLEEFEQKCKHSLDREKLAADAERASIKYKQVEYMQMMEDRVFDGVVTGVTDWGIYVEMVETKCEGMIRMTDLVDDFYELDAENYRIIGKSTKKIIAFGDDLKVKVKDTNLEKRTIDLFLV